MSTESSSGPSQVSGGIKTATGQLYSVRRSARGSGSGTERRPLQTIGAVSSDPSWGTEGEALKKEGADEVEQARANQKSEAAGERLAGKAERCVRTLRQSSRAHQYDSAWGMVMGNQDTMKEGNLKAEKAEWKSAAAEGTVPTMSVERVKGKVERYIGFLSNVPWPKLTGFRHPARSAWQRETRTSRRRGTSVRRRQSGPEVKLEWTRCWK